MFKERNPKRRKLLLIISGSLILIAAAIFSGYKILTENKINRFTTDLSNINCTTSSDIENEIKKLNLNYFYFKEDVVENNLRKKFLCIGQIESEVSYPDHLKLKITGREPKFIVTSINPDIEPNPQIILTLEQLNATQSTSQAFPPKVLTEVLKSYKDASGSADFVVDSEGMIFETARPGVYLPKLSIFSEDLQIGRVVSNETIPKANEIFEKLKDSEITLDNLLVVGDKLIIDGTPRVTFSLSRPIDRQAASLQLILRQAKMNLDPDNRDTRSVESVDLRFDRPVVVYSKVKS